MYGPHPARRRTLAALLPALVALALVPAGAYAASTAVGAPSGHATRAAGVEHKLSPGPRAVSARARRGHTARIRIRAIHRARTSALRPLRIGLNANTNGWGNDMGREQSRVAATGVRYIREEFDWDTIQPTPGTWDFSRYDELVADAAQRGLTVLPLLMRVPSWAGRHPHTLPTDPSDYARFVARVAQRYGRGGDFWREHSNLNGGLAPQYFELWNEPYLPQFSDGDPSPARYARMVKASVIAGRAANPRARFLLAADTTSAMVAGGHDREWIDAMYAAVPDLGRYFDAVAVHPYSVNAPNRFDANNARWQFGRLDQIHRRFAAHGDGGKHLWITEVGFTTCPRNSDCVSETAQASYLTDVYALASTRYRPYVDAVIWYGWHDFGGSSPDPADKEEWFGMIRHDGTPKPALAALRSVTGAAA